MRLTLEQIRENFMDRTPEAIGRHRYFSVLVPLVEHDGQLYLLYETRARHMKSDPGEICFPGGHIEPGEDPANAALRETFEEIGISEDRIEMIGPGNILHGYANYTLYTYLGIVKYEDFLQAKPAEDEVEEVFLVSISDFENHPPQVFHEKVAAQIDEDFPYEKLGIGRDYAWRTGVWDIPVYEIGDRMIWGLTARITENFIAEMRKVCLD